MGYKKVNVIESAKSMTQPWTQLKLGSVENYLVKLAIYKGEYFAHIHEHHDEFIYVLKGKIKIEFDDDTVTLNPGEGIFIEKGTLHKSSCDGTAEVLLVEKDTIMGDFVRVEEK